ncbi:MAG: response regulator [Pseudomonadales bacterium]|nr:response regulator [Pseudomonadales bacterium]
MKNLRILAVDDQLVMRRMYEAMLSDHCELEIAYDGNNGYLIASGKKEAFDLVITDLNMPNLDGVGLIKKLRNLDKYNGIPILVVSTESATVKKNEAKVAGANGWISKPIEKDRLLRAVTKLTR